MLNSTIDKYIAKTLPVFWFTVSGILCVIQIAIAASGIEAGQSSLLMWSAISILLLWHWIYFDAGYRKIHRPFSFGMLIQVYWGFLIPWYFIKTRGWKGVFIPFLLLIVLMAPEFARFWFSN